MKLKMITAAALALLVGTVAVAQVPHEPKPQAPASPPPATPAAPGLDKADLDAWLDGIVPYQLKSGDIAGAVVVVVKDGKVLTEKGYGYADVARKTPMDPARTLIRPGSTSKTFTWTAVMQLVQQGKLDLDRDVNDYLDFKIPQRFGKRITLRDLMNHRAGFEEGLKDILATDPRGLQSTEQYLKLHPRPQLFAPGEVPAYSNYGASLAGYIVQRVSGEPFERYVEHHIFQPLDMTNSTFDQPLPDRFKPALALGYRTASGPPQPYELVVTRPAGSITTTADDMSRFMIAQLQQGRYGDRQILSPQAAQLMQSPSETSLPGFAVMAHGFFYDSKNGHHFIGHGGDTLVFHTEMDLLTQDHVGIYYTFTSRGKADAVYGARTGLFDGFMDRYFPAPPRGAEPPALASAARDAQAIAGLYQSSRRVEHGFISLFYILQQASITANPDGTISAPSGPGDKATYREVGPQLWREVGGDHQLALRVIGGVKTVIDSEDPTTVMQPVPFARSAPLNLNVLMASVAILLWTLVLWPLSPFLRWGERAASGVDARVRRLRLFERGAALFGVVYMIGWYMLLKPVMSLDLGVFNARLDPVVRTLQVGGLVMIAAAAVAVWTTWRMLRLPAPWTSRIWAMAVAAATLGVVWIGMIGKLMSFTLNY